MKCGNMKRYSFPLSWHLVLLVFAGMIPFFVFMALMVASLVSFERKASERALLSTSKELSSAVDREFESSIRILESLATSSALELKNFKNFHQQLVKVLKSQPGWLTIILHDRSGKMLLNASRPFGEKNSATAEPQSLQRLFESAAPVIGNLALGKQERPSDRQYGIPVRVPVNEKGQVVYSLTAVVRASVLQQILVQNQDEWTRTIMDPKGLVAARTRSPEEFIGKPATEDFWNLVVREGAGINSRNAIDGKSVYAAFHRSKDSLWTAAVVLPKEVLDTRAARAKTMVLLGGFILLISFGGIAFFYARRLSEILRSAQKGAAFLAEGQLPTIEKSFVSEVEELRHSLLKAAELLQLRERERNENLKNANLARAEAEEASQAKSEFLANMSHELRTPLGIVLGITEMLLNESLSSVEKEKGLEMAKRNGQQLLRLIDDILDLSKIEASKLKVEQISFSIKDLVSSVVSDFEASAKSKGVGLFVQLQKDLPDNLVSDPVRVRQILHNLIGNALKFTSSGRVDVQINKVKELPFSKLQVVVKDTGVGIRDDQKQNLFSVFTQAEGGHTRRFGGTGLGLALSKKLANLMGGNVELLHSEYGLGSSFMLSLELKDSQKSASTAPKMTSSVSTGAELKDLRILLAEDSEDNVVLILHHLKRAGAKVDVVENGIEAVAKVQESGAHYDLVLMDIQMPEMDGYEATRILRKNNYKVPIVALTAHALSGHRDKAFALGFTDYLTKPVMAGQLLSVIRNCVGLG